VKEVQTKEFRIFENVMFSPKQFEGKFFFKKELVKK
jgi:hypothetical protein